MLARPISKNKEIRRLRVCCEQPGLVERHRLVRIDDNGVIDIGDHMRPDVAAFLYQRLQTSH